MPLQKFIFKLIQCIAFSFLITNLPFKCVYIYILLKFWSSFHFNLKFRSDTLLILKVVLAHQVVIFTNSILGHQLICWVGKNYQLNPTLPPSNGSNDSTCHHCWWPTLITITVGDYYVTSLWRPTSITTVVDDYWRLLTFRLLISINWF